MGGDETVPLSGAPEDDVALMARAATGDAEAFAAIVHRWRTRIYAFAAKMTGDAATADDVTQDVFARAFQARARWRPSARVSTWLYTIAKNAALDRARRSRRTERNVSPAAGANTTGLLGRIPDGALTPCSSAQSMELEIAVEAALAGLPEPYRLPVVLCSIEGMSYAEAAEVVGVNEKTLSSRLARGREMLRDALKPHLGEGTR
jgi:RNA polymerase sigma-70 factor (ECF subfamily)